MSLNDIDELDINEYLRLVELSNEKEKDNDRGSAEDIFNRM